jgi:pseudaminic acid cytidylyltransferase
MPNLAVIPARGGSKRIPRKNIKPFIGKPIIAYSIAKAIECGLFDEVMVSTDDHEIAEIARSLGASVPFMRSEKSADDFATTFTVINEVAETYKKNGRVFDNTCCIYPTAPFIRTEHLHEGLRLLTDKKFITVFPVVRFGYPVWRGQKIDENGKTSMVWPENLNKRSQDLDVVYHDAGQWYWINNSLIKDSLYTDNSGSVILSENEVQDIDTMTDWQIAELKFKLFAGA